MRLHWSFEDPAVFEGTEAEKLEKFRQVRDQIRSRVAAWVDEFQKR
jgi:arsenate reductase